MDISLYTLSKRINSTARPAGEGTVFSGKLREGCDTLSPVIGINLGHNTTPAGYNYAYIAVFGRFYWIQNWRWMAGLWWCECKVDALATWRDYFLPSTQYVVRSSDLYNGNLIDTYYPALITHQTSEVAPEGGSPWTSGQMPDSGGGCYVVGIGSTITSVGSTAYYLLTSSQLQSLITKLLGGITWTGYADGDSDLTEAVYKSLFNPLQYVTSCLYVPFSLNPTYTVSNIAFGWWSLDVAGGVIRYTYSTASRSFTIPAHPRAAARGAYLNAGPYTRLMFDNGPFGCTPLNAALYTEGRTVRADYTFDVITGAGECRIYAVDGQGGEILDVVQAAQVGVPINLSQITQDFIGAAGDVLSGVKDFAAILTGAGRVGSSGGIASAISAMYPQYTAKGANGSFAGLRKAPRLYVDHFDIAEEDRANLGRPFCMPVQLSTFVPGTYVLIEHPDITIPGTDQEQEEIRQHMINGMFLDRPGE